jgi:hypothetical protein
MKFWSDSSCFPSVKPGTEGLPSVEKNKNKIPELICESQNTKKQNSYLLLL